MKSKIINYQLSSTSCHLLVLTNVSKVFFFRLINIDGFVTTPLPPTTTSIRPVTTSIQASTTSLSLVTTSIPLVMTSIQAATTSLQAATTSLQAVTTSIENTFRHIYTHGRQNLRLKEANTV